MADRASASVEAGAADEKAWIEAARGGDEEAFARLVERHKDGVYATVVAITRDFDGAHDICQEVFLRAWFGLGRLQEASSLAAWLRTIARNRCHTWLERRQRQPLRESVDVTELADGADSPALSVERDERRRLVATALARISEAGREALVLHYMEGLATPRMAAVLGFSKPAVRQRRRRARQEMQEEVEEMVADVIRDEAPGADFTDGVSAMLARTKELFQQVQYREAVPVLESARERAPEDTLVSLLLADAYTFTRTPEELQTDSGAYDRALALLDEVVDREPDNALARLRRATLRSALAPEAEVLSEQKAILIQARGGPYEDVAQLELARRYSARGRGREALSLYREIEQRCPSMACVVHSEMGVAHAIEGDGASAIKHFERAVELTTPEAMASLREVSRQLLGEAYWGFWSTVDSGPVRQCQNHAWLAGLRAQSGDGAAARRHVEEAVRCLNSDEVGPARAVLRREFVRRMEEMFPELADEPAVRALREEIEEE